MNKLYDKELPVIETERLILRKFLKNEIEGYSKKSCLVNATYFKKRSYESEINRLNDAYDSFESVGNPLIWGIEQKENHRLIGEIELMHVGIQCIPSVPLNLSIYIFEEYQKQGYAYETISSLLKYINDNFKDYIYFDSITVVVNDDNQDSVNLFLRKYLGFNYLIYSNNHPVLRFGYPNSHILVKPLFATLKFMQEVFNEYEDFKLTEEGKKSFFEARNLQQNQDYNGAISIYSEILKSSQDHSFTFYERGLCYEKLRLFSKAFNDYQKSIRYNPYYGQGYHKLASTFDELGNSDYAIKNYSIAIEINPNDTTSIYNRLHLYLKNNELHLALNDADRLSELGDEDGERLCIQIKQKLLIAGIKPS